jgi:hypothetical protein
MTRLYAEENEMMKESRKDTGLSKDLFFKRKAPPTERWVLKKVSDVGPNPAGSTRLFEKPWKKEHLRCSRPAFRRSKLPAFLNAV